MSRHYRASGGGKCSLCGVEGATKATCPLNPACTSKHQHQVPAGPQGKAKGSPTKTNTKAPRSPAKPQNSPPKIPSPQEIAKIDGYAQKLSALESDKYWVDMLPKKFLFTVADITDLRVGNGTLMVIEPQMYDHLRPLRASDERFMSRQKDLEHFYGIAGGLAVTGSGADTWAVYRPGLLAAMKKLYESMITNRNASPRKASPRKNSSGIVMNAAFPLPSTSDIGEINTYAKELSGLFLNTYWVERMPEKFLLTMTDVSALRDSREGGQLEVIGPQEYKHLWTLWPSDRRLEAFYAYQGHAVTGSGADIWIVYRPGLLAAMKRLFNDNEAIAADAEED